jgi:hypothetical protein
MNKFLLIFSSTVASVGFLQATVTLQIRSQLANGAGTATTGMTWGVLVDTAGDGFSVTPAGSISPFDFSADGIIGGDNYFVGSAATAFAPPFGGNGVALNVNGIPLSGGVGTNDDFGIFWSDGSNNYGFVTTTGATLPSDGFTTAYDSVFTSDPYTAQGSIVPEPSSFAFIAGLLGFGWVMLRRRA